MTMRRTIRGSIVAALAGALALSALDPGPAQAVPVKQQQASGPTTLDLSARRRHHHYYRHYGSNRAALRAFGLVAGTIASIAAAEAARRDCRYYGGCYYDYGYRYGPPRYYYRHRYYYRPGYSYNFYFGF
jgi:hypothetical protein